MVFHTIVFFRHHKLQGLLICEDGLCFRLPFVPEVGAGPVRLTQGCAIEAKTVGDLSEVRSSEHFGWM